MNAIAWLAALGMIATPHHPIQSKAPNPIKVAMICLFQYETTAGMNKICYYDCVGSPAAITVGAAQLCPLTINH